MAYTIDEKDALSRTVTIELTNDDIQKLVNKKLRKLQKTVKIHGFRKGKVPMSVMKQRYGAGAYQEAVEQLINDAMESVSKELPEAVYYGEHNIRSSEDGNILSTVYVEVMPSVDPVGYLGLEVSAPKFELTDEILEANIKGMQEDLAIFEPVEDRDIIEIGDTIRVDIRPISKTVKDLDDSVLTATDVSLYVHEDEEKRASIPDALVGASKSELITTVQKLEDIGITGYGEGESCTLEVTVHSIDRKILPERNDDLALESGLAQTYDELVEILKQRISETMELDRLAILREEVVDRLVEKLHFELPPKFLEREIDNSIRQYLYQLGVQAAAEPDFNLAEVLPNLESAREAMRADVERAVRARHLSAQIAKVDDAIEEFKNEHFEKFLKTFSQRNQVPYNTLLKRLQNRNEAESLAREARFEHVLNYIAQNAEVTDLTTEEFDAIHKEKREKRQAENEERLAKVFGLSKPPSSEEETASDEDSATESEEDNSNE